MGYQPALAFGLTADAGPICTWGAGIDRAGLDLVLVALVSGGATITCSSNNGKRNYCPANTSRGVNSQTSSSGSPASRGKRGGSTAVAFGWTGVAGRTSSLAALKSFGAATWVEDHRPEGN